MLWQTEEFYIQYFLVREIEELKKNLEFLEIYKIEDLVKKGCYGDIFKQAENTISLLSRLTEEELRYKRDKAIPLQIIQMAFFSSTDYFPYLKLIDKNQNKEIFIRLDVIKRVVTEHLFFQKGFFSPYILTYICGKYGHRIFFPKDVEMYKYVSDDGSPMFGDMFYFERHPELYGDGKEVLYIGENGKLKINLSRADFDRVINFFKRIEWIDVDDILKKDRKFLGSSYKPKATKELLRKAVLEGKTDEEIYAMFRDVNPRQLAAIKAHKTRGTYEKK